MKKLKSLTIMFPFYNDEGTVRRQIDSAYQVGEILCDDLQVIALHGGSSKDNTWKEIKKMKQKYPDLELINKKNNEEGYAVIKYGLQKAVKEWVFYTDGDAQYHLEEDFPRLVVHQIKTNADIVNGYKRKRNDSLVRIIAGMVYARLSKMLFNFPIRDIDCDFRLIKKSCLDKIILESRNESILPELIKKLQLAGARLEEIPVFHYKRIYGKSNYTIFSLFKKKFFGDIVLFFKLRKSKNNIFLCF